LEQLSKVLELLSERGFNHYPITVALVLPVFDMCRVENRSNLSS
jgi:hypothetical protein